MWEAERTSSILENGEDDEYHFEFLELRISNAGNTLCSHQLSRNVLDVLLDQVSVGATVDKHFLDASVREKLEGVFDQRGVRKREQTLARMLVSISRNC